MLDLNASRAAFRIAGREIRRHRGRSALILMMVFLPVFSSVVGDVLLRTLELNPAERVVRLMGSADALVRPHLASAIIQNPAGSKIIEGAGTGPGPLHSRAQVLSALPASSRLAVSREGAVSFVTPSGIGRAVAREVDLRQPITAGLMHIVKGRAPRTTGEALTSSALADRGYGLGAVLNLVRGPQLRVVGVVQSDEALREAILVALPGSHLVPPGEAVESFLVQTPGGVSWSQVRAANQRGLEVLSARVLLHPPPSGQVNAKVRNSPVSAASNSVPALAAILAALEIVLLSGPAFAIGARRQRRLLVVVMTAGAERRHAAVVVLSTAFLLAVPAAVAGVGAGVLAAALLRSPLQRFSPSALGVLELRVGDLGAIAGLAVGAALAAATWPALTVARQDIVRALRGGSGDIAYWAGWPRVGLALLLGGAAFIAVGTRRTQPPLVAGGAVLTQIALIILVPAVVGVIARGARKLPAAARIGVRDAARHRSRTTPAICAIMIAVAGTIAVGTASASQTADQRRDYVPQSALGVGVVANTFPQLVASLTRVIHSSLPGAAVGAAGSIDTSSLCSSPTCTVDLRLIPSACPRGQAGSPATCPAVENNTVGSGVGGLVVGDGTVLRGLTGVDDPDAEAMLTRGGIVVLTHHHMPTGQAAIRAVVGGPTPTTRTWTFPVAYLKVDGRIPALAVISNGAIKSADLRVAPGQLYVVANSPITKEAETRTDEAVRATASDDSFTVERGIASNAQLTLWVLAGTATTVTVGGTIAAAGLARADSRADLATMRAVGASPAKFRGVATAQAATTAVSGAILGCVSGLLLGIATGYSLTKGTVGGDSTAAYTGAVIAVPWPAVALTVLAVPVLASLVAGLFSFQRESRHNDQ